MATYVARVGNTMHYADIQIGYFGNRGLHITISDFGSGKPSVRVESIGRVKWTDEAVDIVLNKVKRLRVLERYAKESTDV